MNLTDKHIDAVKELVNIGVGNGAEILGRLLDSHVQLTVPQIITNFVQEKQDLVGQYTDNTKINSVISIPFVGDISGVSQLIMSSEGLERIIYKIYGKKIENDSLQKLKEDAFKEFSNIFLNGVLGVISNLIESHFSFSVPTYKEASWNEVINQYSPDQQEELIAAKTDFHIDAFSLNGLLVIIMEKKSYNNFLQSIEKFAFSQGVSL